MFFLLMILLSWSQQIIWEISYALLLIKDNVNEHRKLCNVDEVCTFVYSLYLFLCCKRKPLLSIISFCIYIILPHNAIIISQMHTNISNNNKHITTSITFHLFTIVRVHLARYYFAEYNICELAKEENNTNCETNAPQIVVYFFK